jgi:predicted ATP-dependent endonuclease of OLD family
MRLVKAEIHGFGRLASGKVNLDNKVIAVVGPNEAGKTTLLRALAYISNGLTLAPSERSRGMDVADDTTVVRVYFLLDDADRAQTVEFDLEEAPDSISFSRKAADSTVRCTVSPAPRKAIAPLASALNALKRSATKKAIAELVYTALEPAEDGTVEPIDEAYESLLGRAEATFESIRTDGDVDGPVAAIERHAGDLRAVHSDIERYGLVGPLSTAIAGVLAWIDRPDPTSAVGDLLTSMAPKILMFDDQDRTLASSHSLTADLIANPPASLRNLAGMAELNLYALWATFTTGDEGERETLIGQANQTLATKFEEAWKQSKLTVVLKTEGSVLAILIKQNGDRITQFDERSAGLKMFVALVAFLAVRDEQVPPVLLIDEAETHLHIDAQADLVNTFMTQQQAAKIIYTTHSPACLPPDLGSNIRAVVPDPNHEYRSVLQGSFWSSAAGFSPLMLAMGAGAAAFSTARYVVLAEGASEMLVLPSLIKSAIDVTDLAYQIAPGLSEVAPKMYPELDLAGARVAYLVDGDKGGLDRRAALIAGGVPEDRIVTLKPLTLENLLDASTYLKVIGLLLKECNPGLTTPDLPELPEPTSEVWPPFLDRWAKQQSLKMPGKRVVASRLVEEGHAKPSDYGTSILRALHREHQELLQQSQSRGRA